MSQLEWISVAYTASSVLLSASVLTLVTWLIKLMRAFGACEISFDHQIIMKDKNGELFMAKFKKVGTLCGACGHKRFTLDEQSNVYVCDNCQHLMSVSVINALVMQKTASPIGETNEERTTRLD